MVPEQSAILALREGYASCFGCGLENAAGLRLDGFVVDEDTATTTFQPPSRFQGFEGVLHGGVVATALDEISAWSAMLTQGVFVFTAKLDISYRQQAPLDTQLVLKATVRDRRGKRLMIDATMTHDDKVVAQSEGLFVVAKEFGGPANEESGQPRNAAIATPRPM